MRERNLAAGGTERGGKRGGASPSGVGGARDRRLVDVLLTAPVFVIYHFGVVFLSVRNGLDPITDVLLSVMHRSVPAYLGLTLLIAAAFWAALRWTKVGGTLRALPLALRLAEAVGYAVLMSVAARAVVAHALGPRGPLGSLDPGSAVVLSMGAGFYEELAFRVALFGVGAWVVHRLRRGVALTLVGEVAWALVAASCFSLVHYVGALGDPFSVSSFVFRLVCGLFLTLVYRTRGFATAVWTHALYDVGVMAF